MVISDLYATVILTLGQFHELDFIQILQSYYCMSNKGWFVDSGIIAQGSSHQYFEEIHYFQSMRWRKEQDR